METVCSPQGRYYYIRLDMFYSWNS